MLGAGVGAAAAQGDLGGGGQSWRRRRLPVGERGSRHAERPARRGRPRSPFPPSWRAFFMAPGGQAAGGRRTPGAPGAPGAEARAGVGPSPNRLEPSHPRALADRAWGRGDLRPRPSGPPPGSATPWPPRAWGHRAGTCWCRKRKRRGPAQRLPPSGARPLLGGLRGGPQRRMAGPLLPPGHGV